MTTLAAIGKKALLFLLGDKKGRKAMGYTIGIAVFLALLPLIVVMGCSIGCSVTAARRCGSRSGKKRSLHTRYPWSSTKNGRCWKMTCGDEAYRCLGVGAGCAEAGESRGVVRVRGGVTPFGKADRKGGFWGICGMLRKSLRCRAAMSETAILRGRSDVGKDKS